MNYIKKILPNTLTFLNLSLGILAILTAIKETNINSNIYFINMCVYASLLILVAAFTDRLDGKVARLLGTTSELGKQLDSLSDLISFGLAPIIVTWKICLFELGFWGYISAIIFPLAGAYRLARFNISSSNGFFTGVPITVSGAFLAIINLYSCFCYFNGSFNNTNVVITVLFIYLLSFLMISRFKLKKI